MGRRLVLAGGLASAVAGLTTSEAAAASAAELDHDAAAALEQLYSTNPRARELGKRSHAILIFPKVVKAGLVVGGLTGQGALRQGNRSIGYYRITAGTYGLQAGAQSYSYALFFITQSSLDYLKRSDGWSIGSGPSVVVIDEGVAGSLNSTTLTQDVYVAIFGQRGLMAGLGLEGAKISKINLR